jgi:hypothetical protein
MRIGTLDASRRPVFGQHDMPALRLGHTLMSYKMTGIELDLHPSSRSSTNILS